METQTNSENTVWEYQNVRIFSQKSVSATSAT